MTTESALRALVDRLDDLAKRWPEHGRKRMRDTVATALPAIIAAARQPWTVEPEGLARLFHETYERLAPDFGYETRRESAVPWEQVPENNRRLMVAVAAAILAALEQGR